MENRIFSTLAVALGTALLGASVSFAGLAVPGNYQNEAGYGNDWTPADAPYMTDQGPGLFELPLTGLTGAVSLTRFNFKILDDGGNPPAEFGVDPEVPNNGPGSPDNWFVTDANGDATIMLDRHDYTIDSDNGAVGQGFLPAMDRITVSTDTTEFTSYYATGTWEDEAGGTLGDFSGGDPLFEMSNLGGDLWGVDVTISTPGSYSFKATADGDFAYQWGTNGRLNDSANYSFVTVAADQQLTFMLDLAKGAIGYSTETFLAGDTDSDGVIEFEDDFGPIRDNWLNSTFLRADGNIDNTGDSEGVIDITDFRQWKNACEANPGTCILPGGGMAAAFASLGGGGTVPEPSSAVLAIVAGLSLMAGTRKRRRRTASPSGTAIERTGE